MTLASHEHEIAQRYGIGFGQPRNLLGVQVELLRSSKDQRWVDGVNARQALANNCQRLQFSALLTPTRSARFKAFS